MQSRASVAKVGRLRWGVSIARAHWCMNAAKSNASLDRQEGVGKVKPARRERAAVHRRQGATIPPSLPLSFFLSCLFLLYSTYLFICLFFFISNSLPLLSVRCHGRGHSPNKVQRSQRECDRNKETEREHSYSENISISPKEYQLNWYWMNPTPPSLFFHSSLHILLLLLSFLSPRPLPRCHGVLFINMCKSLFLSTRWTAGDIAKRHWWTGVVAWLPNSGSLAEARRSEWWVRKERLGD